MKAAIVGGQLARRYGLPYRTSSTNAANAVDAQSAYETVFSLWGAIMGGGNFIIHCAGWMEGGLVASYEKFVLDVDLLHMVTEFLKAPGNAQDGYARLVSTEAGRLSTPQLPTSPGKARLRNTRTLHSIPP
jgi:trimethylamine--corrinoid protein Co-methyltransferase